MGSENDDDDDKALQPPSFGKKIVDWIFHIPSRERTRSLYTAISEDIFFSVFKPYESLHQLGRDVFQPLLGIGNLVCGLFLSLTIPLPLTSFIVFTPVYIIQQLLKKRPLDALRSAPKALSKHLEDVFHMMFLRSAEAFVYILGGMLQVVTYPLTIAIKLHLRLAITLVTLIATLRRAKEASIAKEKMEEIDKEIKGIDSLSDKVEKAEKRKGIEEIEKEKGEKIKKLMSQCSNDNLINPVKIIHQAFTNKNRFWNKGQKDQKEGVEVDEENETKLYNKVNTVLENAKENEDNADITDENEGVNKGFREDFFNAIKSYIGFFRLKLDKNNDEVKKTDTLKPT